MFILVFSTHKISKKLILMEIIIAIFIMTELYLLIGLSAL